MLLTHFNVIVLSYLNLFKWTFVKNNPQMFLSEKHIGVNYMFHAIFN